MKRSWYRRLLFSYLPVFFIIISLLVTIFVFSLVGITKRAAEAIDQGSAQHVMQMVDNALENTEYQFIRMLDSNLNSGMELQGFFMAADDDPLNSDVIPARRLTALAIENPLIDSVYMVRWSDEKVLIHNTSTYLSQFEDKQFVESFRKTADYGSWSGQRPFRIFSSQNATNVVSMVRPYPVLNGNSGILVVNINVSAILNLVHDIAGSAFLSLQVVDQNNQIFHGTTNYASTGVDHPNAEVISERTGWKLYTEIHGNLYLQYASKLMYGLWFSGIAAVIGAVIYIAYVSRRNYKPILKLTEQIESYSKKRVEHLFKRADKDEFSFIEHALDKIIEETDDYMQQKVEHLKHKKKHSLKALLDGQFETFNKEMPEIERMFGWPLRERKHYVIVAEIDRYNEFQKQYSRRDQSLLKFVIMNVFNEVMLEHRLQSEGDWLLPNLWVAVMAKPDGDEEEIREVIKKVLVWIKEQLNFTITFGIGESADQVEDIHQAYERSMEVLQYKSSFGSNRLIGHWDMQNSDDMNPVTNMIKIQQIASMFKRQDSEWKKTYQDFVCKLQEQMLIKDDTWYLLNYFIYQLTADIYALNNDYRRIWDQHILPDIQAVMSEVDMLQDIHQPLLELLEKAEREYSVLRNDRTYSATMQSVKQFIEEHHADPQLSLNFLSDSFHLNPKYLSHLFKEETGEKFSDYLTEVRISHAKRLLLSTNDSVQAIAECVGYNHAFSFIRAFKKMAGLTPGDYRRNFMEN